MAQTIKFHGAGQSAVTPNISMEGMIFTFSGNLGGTFTNVATPLATALAKIQEGSILPFAVIAETNSTGAGTRLYTHNGSAWKYVALT